MGAGGFKEGGADPPTHTLTRVTPTRPQAADQPSGGTNMVELQTSFFPSFFSGQPFLWTIVCPHDTERPQQVRRMCFIVHAALKRCSTLWLPQLWNEQLGGKVPLI